MGVTNSKRVYGPEKPEESKGAEAAAGPGQGEGKEEPKPEEEGPVDDKAEMEKWKPFFKAVLKMPEVKDKIKTLILQSKADKGELIKKGILLSADDISDFTNGKNGYLGDIILFLGKGIPSAAPAEGDKKDGAAPPAADGAAPPPADGAKKDEAAAPPANAAPSAAEGDKPKGGESQAGGGEEAPPPAEGAAPAEGAEGAEPEGLQGPEGPLKFNQAKATAISDEKMDDKKPTRTLKPDTKFTAIDKDILLPLVEATKVAIKHKKFLKVLKEYITDTDSFKTAHKETNISGSEEAIKSGKKTKEEAAKEEADKNKPPEEEGKEGAKEEGAKEEGAKEGGADDMDGGDDISVASSVAFSSGGSSQLSFDGGDARSLGGYSSDPRSIGGMSYVSNSSYNSNSSGGSRFWKNDQEKLDAKLKSDYKKFKKQSRKDFKGQTEEFFKDTAALNKFMDEPSNQTDILALMYSGKIPGRWIDKSDAVKSNKKSIALALVKAINAHAGIAAASADAAPAEGADAGAPAEGADKGANIVPTKGDAFDEAANNAGSVSQAITSGGAHSVQAGGGAQQQQQQPQQKQQKQEQQDADTSPPLKRKTKQKKFTRKKPKNINIRINVGDNNAICDEESSSSDSDTSNTDTSDSDESESDDELEEKIIKKFAGRKNKRTRRKNLTGSNV